jgi:hypothetical protein
MRKQRQIIAFALCLLTGGSVSAGPGTDCGHDEVQPGEARKIQFTTCRILRLPGSRVEGCFG